MKTEENNRKRGSSNINLNKDIFNTKFITYINILSDSIREYYKVSLNIFKNKNILILSLEKKINGLGYEFNISKEFKVLINQLKININSGKENLMKFLNDAKTIFNEMKQYQNIIKNNIINKRTYINNNTNLKNNIYKSLYYHPEINYKSNDSQNSFYIHKNNFLKIYKDIGNTNNNRRKTNSAQRNQNPMINEEMINNSAHILVDKNTFSNNNKLIEDIKKIKKLNNNY